MAGVSTSLVLMNSSIIAHVIQDMRADLDMFAKRYPDFRRYMMRVEKSIKGPVSLSDLIVDEAIETFLYMGTNAGFLNETMEIDDNFAVNRRSATTYARLLSLKTGKRVDVAEAKADLKKRLGDNNEKSQREKSVERRQFSSRRDEFPLVPEFLKLILEAPLPLKEKQEFLNKTALLNYLFREPAVVGTLNQTYRNNWFQVSTQLHQYGKSLHARAAHEIRRASKPVQLVNEVTASGRVRPARPTQYTVNDQELDRTIADLIEITVPQSLGGLRTRYVARYLRAIDMYENKLDFSGPSDPIDASSSWQKIQRLIGMGEAKDMLRNFASEVLFDEAMTKAGIPVAEPTSKHFVIVGPPGTGKTELAKLAAEFLFEIGVLKEGDYYRLTRHNVLQGYVGQTDVKAKELFARIAGSLGHVDEAYAFVKSEGSNDYGQDFINALVDHIEEDRGNSVFCFTGYPDKMLGFFESNEGLLSRMGCIIALGHYEADELKDIFKLQAKQQSLIIDDEAMRAVDVLIEKARDEADKHFGNGRFTRNIAEALKRQVSSRNRALLIEAKQDPSRLSDPNFVDALRTVTAADVEAVSLRSLADLKGHSMQARLQEAARKIEPRKIEPGPQTPRA